MFKNFIKKIDSFFPLIFFIVLFVWVIILSVFNPKFISSNRFLDDFVGSQLLSLLLIILTITFASVANIHLALNRFIESHFPDNIEEGYEKSKPSREEINSNAWLLFWIFILFIVLLLVEGALPENPHVESFVYGSCLLIILLNVWALSDVYRTVYVLVSTPTKATEKQQEQYPRGGPTA